LSNKRSQEAAGTESLLDGRYRILRLLGEGGMGAVFLAEHAALGRQVAIKFLHAEYATKEEMVGRFAREAQAAAAIHHKNIIEVFDVGISQQGEPFLVMEYLEGESLAQLLKRAGPLNLAATCAVIEPALLALRAAHRKGIIHRDLKPDNLFLAYLPDESPVVKLIDFGISKFTQGESDKLRTKTGSIMGTPAYMSPEQARALPGLDHRSDLYSMGTIMYEMLVGALPYAGNSFSEYLANLLMEEPRPPLSLRADFPAEAEPVLRRAMAKEPSARFQTADEMLEALQELKSFKERVDRLSILASTIQVRAFAAGDLGPTLPAVNVPTAPKSGGRPWWDATAMASAPPKRRRTPSIVAGLAALLCLFVAGTWWLFGRSPVAKPVSPALHVVTPEPSAVAPAPAAPPEAVPRPNEAASETSSAKAAAHDPGIEPTAGKPPEIPNRGRARSKTSRGALGSSEARQVPSQDSNGDKGTGKSLRSGARGTKMSESFE
jgi:serine/threonine protein kinase